MENEIGDIRSQSIKYKKLQTLMYHINKATLIKEHQKQNNNKASGIDKMTKEKYEVNLYNNIDELIQSLFLFTSLEILVGLNPKVSKISFNL